MIATHLADATALAQLSRTDVAARLVSLVVGGAVATCRIIDLEVLQAFEGDERAEAAVERSMFPRVAVDDAVQDRAVEVQGLVARRVPIVTLLVAAAAERAELVLLHDDDAYDVIAAVTGQPVERVVP